MFLWSEEHARDYRAAADRVDAMIMTLDQAVYVTRIVQSALFAFGES